MITITLNQIRKHHPCGSGWKTLLKHLGKTKADDEAFPFSTIIESNGLDDAIWALRCLDDQAPARLFAVACTQEILHLMEDERSIKAVRVAHLFAHGECDNNGLLEALAAAWAGAAAWAAAWAAARAAAWAAAGDASLAAPRIAQRDWLIAIADNYEEATR